MRITGETGPATASGTVDAGAFGAWLHKFRDSLQGDSGMDVPCGDCTGCCTSGYSIQLRRSDVAARAQVPVELTVEAPGFASGELTVPARADGTCPMLRAGRERLIDDATRRGVGIVVIDAPLLFEAGVDRECDEVWFIDAPREQRLARVKASRGWDEAELDRREGAQLQADEKRRRSTRVIVNDGDEGALIAQVRVALGKATADARSRRLSMT